MVPRTATTVAICIEHEHCFSISAQIDVQNDNVLRQEIFRLWQKLGCLLSLVDHNHYYAP